MRLFYGSGLRDHFSKIMTKLDAFKIQITLTESQNIFVPLWLERFNARTTHIWFTPELSNQTLTIHPADFTNLISFAEPGDCSELEFYRLRKLGATAIESILSKQKSPLSQELKDMALDALRGFTPQEYVTEPFQELSLPESI